MEPILPYIATTLATVGLAIMLAAGLGPSRQGGAVLGLAGLIWLFAMPVLPDSSPEALTHTVFMLVFSLCAIASAVQMIVQQRPVYAALFFVIVVLSICGMLVMLEAFFMAFALVIVYAGAILITYMFVLMLAQQASAPDQRGELPDYDRRPREPVAAVCGGAFLMGVVVTAVFFGVPELPPAATMHEQRVANVQLLEALPGLQKRALHKGGFQIDTLHHEDGRLKTSIHVDEDGYQVAAQTQSGETVTVAMDPPGNTAHVGWSLVADFPASLEVAGVILLMAMFGAVVLARRQVEHAEADLAAATYGESGEVDT